MNRKQIQFVISLLIVAIQSCSNFAATPIAVSVSSPPNPTSIHTVTPASAVTLTPTSMSHPTPTITPIPSWATIFAGSILAAIKDKPPSFQDDFSYSHNKGWYVGFIGHPTYVLTIEKGILFVRETKLNQGCDPISNLAMSHPNFVLQVDLPGNYGDVSFHGFMGGGPRYSFNIEGQGTGLGWRFGDIYGKEQFGDLVNTSSTNLTQAIIIKKYSKAAFYLNNIPVAYVDDPILNKPIYGVMLNCGEFDNRPLAKVRKE